MHIVVMGAGGVGGYFGAKLARAGESVTLVARGEHLAAIRRDGLRLRSAVEGEYVVRPAAVEDRSEEHTSELQSPCNLVCRLLLEKKKKNYRERSGSSVSSVRHRGVTR